jgi:L-alanine-DL-glutamate epimerase-like enolase superfamily enzyme
MEEERVKIVEVKALPLKIPETEFWGGKGGETRRRDQNSDYVLQPGWLGLYSSKIETCLVRIRTEDGTVGYGEGQSPIGPEVTATIVERVLRPVLLGEDAMRVGVLRRTMYETLIARGHFTGYLLDAIAGVDSALWDLKGKVLGRPVSDLLGGAFRMRIPAYVSGLKGDTVEAQIATAQEYVQRGFRAIKVFLTEGGEADIRRVRRIREALSFDVKLMVDVLSAYDLTAAMRLGSVLDELDIAWFETPIHPEDLEGHAELARVLRLPVAGGETDRTRYQFRRQFQQRALEIAQPDVGRCGITEGKAIAELADAFHVPITMHTGMASAVLIAASLQLGASIPDCRYQEYQPFVHAVANRFIKSPLVCDQGHYEVPTGPGLGIELDQAALSQYVV